MSAVLLAAGGCSEPFAPSGQRVNRPNIIVIVTDDLDTLTLEYMPRVQRLLQDRGVTFSNDFVTTPLCCPSRSSMLRGQYAHNHTVIANSGPLGGYQQFLAAGDEQSTIATWLSDAGYRTALIGKYLLGYPLATQSARYVPPGWSDWFSIWGGTAGPGQTPYYGYRMTTRQAVVDFGFSPSDYATDVEIRTTLAFLRTTPADARPYFLYLATAAPHPDAVPAPRYIGRYAGIHAPRPPSFDEADVSDKPSWLRRIGPLTQTDIDSVDRVFETRVECALALDDMVDSIVTTLASLGQLQNTYIFFTSDNGFHLGVHRLMPDKATPYEDDIRVPLVVAGPTTRPGTRSDALVLNIDLAPTIADLAGVVPPAFVDGRSYAAELGVPETADRRRAFLAESAEFEIAQAYQPDPRKYGWTQVHQQSSVFTRWNTGELEYYDLAADPYQLTNVASQMDLVTQLQYLDYLQRLSTCRGATCRMLEDAGVPRSGASTPSP